MKHTLPIITCLCVVMLSLLVMTSCQHTSSEASTSPPADTTSPSVDAYAEALTSFYQANKAVLTRVAEKVLSDGVYAYHTYFPTATPGGASSEVYSYVMPTEAGGTFQRIPATDETLLALSQTTFYGDVTHTEGNTVVAFRPQDQAPDTTMYLVYAISDSDMTYLQNDFLPNSTSVTITPIEGHWYLVVA